MEDDIKIKKNVLRVLNLRMRVLYTHFIEINFLFPFYILWKDEKLFFVLFYALQFVEADL